jgi:hypothetical protein
MSDTASPSRRILPIAEAVHLLAPNATWSLEGDEITNLVWESDPSLRPSNQAILAKAEELLNEAPMRALRRVRDARLRETDWVTLRAMRTGEPIPQEWKDYMQALADITKNSNPQLVSGELVGVTWPERPDGETAGQGRFRVIR